MAVKIENIQFIPIKPQSGLVGFASCEIDGLFYLGSLGVYTNLGNPGSFRITYPCKKLSNGELVKIFFPLTEEINEAITKAISLKVQELLDGSSREEVNQHADNSESQ